MANATLSPEVTDILSRAVITGNLLVLPPGQLERKLYEQVAKAIKAAGGSWKTNKQGFVFDSDPRAKLGLALRTGGVIDEKKLLPYQQRVVEEKAELDARLDKLSAFIESFSQFKELERADRHLLIQQEAHMRKLSNILAKRIKRFTRP